MPQNMWPDFDVLSGPRLPKRALIEEGKGIAERTKGVIEFEVIARARAGTFVYDCYLTVPTINFRYPFMTVNQKSDSPYPVSIKSDTFPEHRAADSEQAFVEELRQVFQSDVTKRIVQQLLDAAA